MTQQPVILRPRQVPHFNFMVEGLQTHHTFLDLSKMGCGKTPVWCAISQYYNMPIIVVTTPTGTAPWERERARYGINILGIISYDSLRSIKGKQPKHGLLTRYDTKTDAGTAQVTFVPTPALLQYIEHGVLFIFDECAKLKNKCDTWRAALAITSAVCRSTRSRTALLSAAAFDNEDNAEMFARLMGYIVQHRLYVHHENTDTFELLGIQDLIDNCRRINNEATDLVLQTHVPNRNNSKKVIYELLMGVLKPVLSSAMPPPELDVVCESYNGYFDMSPQDAKKAVEAIQALSNAARFNRETGTIGGRENVNWGGITTALRSCEEAEVNLYTRLVTKTLTHKPLSKVVVFVNFTEPLTKLVRNLDRFNPLILYGKTSKKDRAEICRLFSYDDNYRLIVANLGVGGASLDLQDLVGGRDRYLFFSTGSYKMLDYYQGTGRTHREGALGNTYIYFVYGKITREKTSILNALARKGSVMRRLLDKQVEAGIKFPDEYPIYEEVTSNDDQPLQLALRGGTPPQTPERVTPQPTPSPEREDQLRRALEAGDIRLVQALLRD